MSPPEPLPENPAALGPPASSGGGMSVVGRGVVVLLVLAAVVPLGLYGLLSVRAGQRDAGRIVLEAQRGAAVRTAEQISLLVSGSLDLLHSLADNLQRADLKDWQKERVLRNYALSFPALERMWIVAPGGKVLGASRPGRWESKGAPRMIEAALAGREGRGGVEISPVLLPVMAVGLPLVRLGKVEGALLCEVNLVGMWRWVDRVAPPRGRALLVSEQGTLLAASAGEDKPGVVRARSLATHPLTEGALEGRVTDGVYPARGGPVLGVAAPVPGVGWALLLEEPEGVALEGVLGLRRKLLEFGAAALLLVAAVGLVGVARIERTARAQEREATFSTVARGLAHDLASPLKAASNVVELLGGALRRTDRKGREALAIAERALAQIGALVEDLRLSARTRPGSAEAVPLGPLLGEELDSARVQGDGRLKVALKVDPPGLRVWGDRRGLHRILSNVFSNAVQAMNGGGGRLQVCARKVDRSPGSVPSDRASGGERGWIEIEISDSGSGISPEHLGKIFRAPVTSSGQGLGLGLYVTRLLLDQMGGSIQAESPPGGGTTVRVRLPAA